MSVLEEDRSGHPSRSNMFMTHTDEMVQADTRIAEEVTVGVHHHIASCGML